MIKGKKIESVNLQLLHTTKSHQKQGGFAVGKEFMLQKKDISAVKDQKQYLMEQDITQKCKSQMETQQKNNRIQVQSNQWTKTAQTKSKNQNGCDLKSTKVIQKMANGRKKSKERQPVKKQNRMINNKPIKQTKNEVVKEETSMKNTKKQQKKSDTLEISLKMQKKNSQHIQKPISNNLNMHLPPTPIPQSQLIQDTNHSFQEVEQERIQTPNPIIQQNIDPEIDYLQQISFGNQQQAASMPLNPMRYENSNDQECLGDNYLCTTQNEEEYISHPNDKELNLDSQLFSLTAQQLLAKEYFSI